MKSTTSTKYGKFDGLFGITRSHAPQRGQISSARRRFVKRPFVPFRQRRIRRNPVVIPDRFCAGRRGRRPLRIKPRRVRRRNGEEDQIMIASRLRRGAIIPLAEKSVFLPQVALAAKNAFHSAAPSFGKRSFSNESVKQGGLRRPI